MMELSTEEKEIINVRRHNITTAKAKLEAGFMIITVAKEWADYAEVRDLELTYSGFCNWINSHRSIQSEYLPYYENIFEGVRRIISCVDDLAIQIGSDITRNR